jgi:cytochrome P450
MFNLPQSLNRGDWYRQMLEEHPVCFDEQAGAWLVFRAEDVIRVLANHHTFSAAVPLNLPSTFMNMDPPQQKKYRRLIASAFTPRAAQELAPQITAWVEAFLTPLVPAGTMDVVTDLAAPLSFRVIAHLLGIPEAHPQVQGWTNAFAAGASLEALESLPEVQAIMAYLAEIITARKKGAAPSRDLISILLAEHLDGRSLSEEELLSNCGLLLTAGTLNTTQLLTWSCYVLTQIPHLLGHLQQEPETVGGFIEEVLRTQPPFPRCMRVATRTTELGGHIIQEGQFVMAVVAAANYDEARFDHPFAFEIKRCPNDHLAFGAGAHFCLGAPLARLETRIALLKIIERIESMHLPPNVVLEPVGQGFVHGFAHLPIIFTARQTAGTRTRSLTDTQN